MRGLEARASKCRQDAGAHQGVKLGYTEIRPMIQVDLRSAIPLPEQIHAGFRELVMKGLLKSGDPLPPPRQLAEALLISPAVVTRSYQEMAKLGFVEKKTGAYVISERAWRQSTESLLEALQDFLESAQKARRFGFEWNDLQAVLTRLSLKGDKSGNQEDVSEVLQQLHFLSRRFVAGTTSCPYCREVLQEGNAIFCAFCGTAHHQECWNETEHCSVYGCKGKVSFEA